MIIQTVINLPEFIEAIAEELRGEKKKSSPSDEEDSDEDDIGRRVKHLIALRMKKRHAEHEG